MNRLLSLIVVSILSIVIASSCSEQSDSATNIEQESAEMSRYVVAIKREKRDEMSFDWTQQVAETPGVELDPSNSSRRVMVNATETGIEKLREKLGDKLHIELIVEHQKY